MAPRTSSSSKYLLEIPTEVKCLPYSKNTKQCLISERREIYLGWIAKQETKETNKIPWGSESNVMKVA